jgi:hypothetical protein
VGAEDDAVRAIYRSVLTPRGRARSGGHRGIFHLNQRDRCDLRLGTWWLPDWGGGQEQQVFSCLLRRIDLSFLLLYIITIILDTLFAYDRMYIYFIFEQSCSGLLDFTFVVDVPVTRVSTGTP